MGTKKNNHTDPICFRCVESDFRWYFQWTFLKIKNVGKIKNVKKRKKRALNKKRKKRFLHLCPTLHIAYTETTYYQFTLEPSILVFLSQMARGCTQSWQWVTFYDPRDLSVNWPVTHESRLLTSHCHSVTFAYPREREVSMRFRFHTVPTPSP